MTTKAASPAAAAPVTATAAANNEMTENIAYMTLMHELKAAFPNLSDDAVKQCVLENGPDRDRCVAALTSELDNANSVVTATSSSSTPPPPPPSSSAPSMRRYSLQGRQQRLRRHSLVSSSGVSSMTEQSMNNNQRRRRNSCFALNCEKSQLTGFSGQRRKSSSTTHCDLEVSGSSSTIPMVVLTPESPRTSPSAQIRTLFSPEEGGDNGVFGDQGQLGHYNQGQSDLGRQESNTQSGGGGGFFIMGNSSNLTATCLDIDEEDLLNNNSNSNGNDNEATVTVAAATSSEDEDGSGSSSGFSLSTATLSHGELRLMQSDSTAPVATTAFTRIRCKSITVSPGMPPKSSTTTSTIFKPVPSSSAFSAPSHDCPEHPFRKLFAKRKEFYQTISQRKENYSSVNRLLWRKRHCALCCADSRSCSAKNHEQQQLRAPAGSGGGNNKKITLNANIEPFPPFTIRHDVDSGQASIDGDAVVAAGAAVDSEARVDNSENMELTPDGKELRYAKSTINSEDGVESHLEVSVGVDGQSVVTTTRHKRLGSPSENCSVMRLGIGEDGAKILNIEQSRRERPSSLFLPPPPPQMFQKSSSAYCTQINNVASPGHFNHFETSAAQSMLAQTGYNSLPSWYGGLRQPPMMPMLFLEAAKALELESAPPPPQMVYNSHPADEEKRLAFTRALLSHQMEQRLNLERTLRDEREKLNSMRVDVREMEHKVNQKMLVRLGPLNMRQGDVMKNTDAIERDIGVLRNTCDEMADEVTKITKGAVPLGETSIAFYESLISENGGAPAFAGSGDGETPTPTTTTTPGRTSPPPRPPPPRQPARTAPPPPAASSSSEEGPQWSCSECTFLNHPALDKCEQCEMARVGLGGTTASSDVENRTSDCFCHPSTTAAAASRQQLQQFMSVEPPTQPSSRSSNSNRAGISKSFSVDHPPHNFNS